MSLESDINSFVKSVDLELFETTVVAEGDDTIYRVSVVSKNIVDGKRESITLDKCVDLTRLISPLLDVTPPVSGDYRLEVSSAGIDKKLTSIKHFLLSIGERVSILALDKRKIRGILTKVQDSTIIISTEDEVVEIEFNDINKAKTYFEW